MCSEGAALYRAWVALVPQIKPGDENIRAKLAQKPPAAEDARRAYEAHRAQCSICRDEHINARQLAEQMGFELPNNGEVSPEWR